MSPPGIEKVCANPACQMPHARRWSPFCVACEAEAAILDWKTYQDRNAKDADRRAAYWAGLAANARAFGKPFKALGYDSQVAKVRKEQERMRRFYQRKIDRDLAKIGRTRAAQRKRAEKMTAAGTPPRGSMWLDAEERGRS